MHYIKLVSLLALLSLAGCSSTSTSKGPDADNKTVNNKRVVQSKPNSVNSFDDVDRALAQLANYKSALALLSNGKLDAAAKKFLAITQLQPQLAGPWANLAIINIKKNNLTTAKAFAQQAIVHNPKSSDLLNIAGSIAFEQGEAKKALEYYSKATEYAPSDPQLYYNLALVYDTYLQNIPQAIAYYEKYLALAKIPDKRTQTWLNELKSSLGQ